MTRYFTRYTTPNNCAKLAALYCFIVDKIDEHFKNYFPHTYMRWISDFNLYKENIRNRSIYVLEKIRKIDRLIIIRGRNDKDSFLSI